LADVDALREFCDLPQSGDMLYNLAHGYGPNAKFFSESTPSGTICSGKFVRRQSF
jgi:hypothetical protein